MHTEILKKYKGTYQLCVITVKLGHDTLKEQCGKNAKVRWLQGKESKKDAENTQSYMDMLLLSSAPGSQVSLSNTPHKTNASQQAG